MSKSCLSFTDVYFRYDTSPADIISACTLHFNRGWTGITGANGAGKTTLLKLAAGLLSPSGGSIARAGDSYYCEQRTDTPPDCLESFLDDFSGDAAILRGILGIGPEWLSIWSSLSHGERKRAQLAAALWKSPAILAIDEPTNHIDKSAKSMLLESLLRYEGIGLIVSHDREFLDRLCSATVFVTQQSATIRPGGYTKSSEQLEIEKLALERQAMNAKRELSKLKKELQNRREKADASKRLGSKKGLAPGDSDTRQKINAARLTGKDAVAGRLSAALEARIGRIEEKRDFIHVKTTHPTGISINAEPSKRDFIFRMPPGCMEICPDRTIKYPEIVIRPGDRIAIQGDNGSGKSTLVAEIARRLKLPHDEYIYLPQEFGEETAARLAAEVKTLPPATLGYLMTIVSRLNSRPEKLLASQNPSPGEARKLMLALGLLKNPCLIIMDEPTNHLDIVSIECIEAALRQCSAALLLVSHDDRFLRNLSSATWVIKTNGNLSELVDCGAST